MENGRYPVLCCNFVFTHVRVIDFTSHPGMHVDVCIQYSFWPKSVF